jgi:hypothetical protein
MVAMGLAVAGMLGMAYYNCVLSVYRGGGRPENRQMARLTLVVAFASIAGLVALRLGTIMSAVVTIAAGPDTVFDLVQYYTMSRIDYQATLGANEAIKGTLDWQLTIASLLLFLSFMGAMAGLVGTSARSLGGSSRRVRWAASLPTTGVMLVAVALLLLAWASATAGEAARESWGIDDLEVPLGWGLYLGVLLAIGALAGALGYLRLIGRDFAVEALAIWRKAEVPDAEAAEEGIPQPMLDQVLAEEARAAEAAGTFREESPPPSIRIAGREITLRPRRMQMVLFAVIIAVIIIVAVLVPGGPGGNGGNGGEKPVVISQLPRFSEDHALSEYLGEGDRLSFNAIGTIIQGDLENNVYFVDSVTVRLAWVDEPSAGVLWTNQPDTFEASAVDNQGLDDPSGSTANPQGGEGRVSLDWASTEAWFVVGNTDLVDWGQQQVFTESDVVVEVVMEEAGNQVTPLGRVQTDGGNSFTLTVTVSGHVHSDEPGGQ